MRTRDDIDLANTWVVSDTHFGHDNIVGFCHRPEDHEQAMIAEWRAQVPDDATVLHLGDLSYRGNARFKHILSKELTGERFLLIKGNHDKQGFGFYRDCGFKLARPFALQLGRAAAGGFFVVTEPEDAAPDDILVSFSHYPWDEREEGRPMRTEEFVWRPGGLSYATQQTDWRLHGHIHNNGYQRGQFVPFLKNHINLSVEQMRYTPVNLKVLLEAAILGLLPSSQENEDALAAAARERSITRRTESKAN